MIPADHPTLQQLWSAAHVCKANFDPLTGLQTTFDNCWAGWRIEPLEVQP